MTDTPDHLGTDHLAHDLAVRSTRGSVAVLAAEATKFLAGTGATMVLARLLRPDDFGLAAMALATIAILGNRKDVGLSPQRSRASTSTRRRPRRSSG